MILEATTEEHLKALTHLMLALWPECRFEEEYANNSSLLRSGSDVFYLAKEADQYAGFAHISLRTEYVEGTHTGHVGYLEGLYVSPNFRKTGIGKALVEAGAVWAREHGCTEYASDTEISNTASIDFHKSLGFEEVNRVVCFAKKV